MLNCALLQLSFATSCLPYLRCSCLLQSFSSAPGEAALWTAALQLFLQMAASMSSCPLLCGRTNNLEKTRPHVLRSLEALHKVDKTLPPCASMRAQTRKPLWTDLHHPPQCQFPAALCDPCAIESIHPSSCSIAGSNVLLVMKLPRMTPSLESWDIMVAQKGHAM